MGVRSTLAHSTYVLTTHLSLRYGGLRQTTMAKEPPDRLELLQGTLEMMVLRTLLFGPANGYQIAKTIEQMSDDVLQVDHGSLYPALHRLEKRGWLSAKWSMSDTKRRARFYRLTAAGRRKLVSEQSKWDRLAGAIARVMRPVKEN
jgi:PadR family transcriptional regulator